MDIKSVIKNRNLILEGVKNSLIKKEDVEKIAKERSIVCDVCPVKSINSLGKEICDSEKQDVDYNTGKMGNGCGCYLHLKQRSLHSSCPLHKWEALTDDAEVGNILKNL